MVAVSILAVFFVGWLFWPFVKEAGRAERRIREIEMEKARRGE